MAAAARCCDRSLYIRAYRASCVCPLAPWIRFILLLLPELALAPSPDLFFHCPRLVAVLSPHPRPSPTLAGGRSARRQGQDHSLAPPVGRPGAPRLRRSLIIAAKAG
eukprot:scaffold10691_cov95-Isochrysis_galbana.AAC.4